MNLDQLTPDTDTFNQVATLASKCVIKDIQSKMHKWLKLNGKYFY